MPLLHEGQEYLNATEAAEMLHMSRQHFYDIIQPTLETHYIGKRTRPYYRRDDVSAAGVIRTEKPLPIVIHGIQKNFVKSIQELGIPCTVQNVGVPSIVSITDQELAEIFHAKIGDPIVRRGRLQGVQGTPYRSVVNWYSTKFCDAELLETMRIDDDADMPILMKEKFGVVIQHIVETVSTRRCTPEERDLLRMRLGDSVYQIRRVNYATDGMTAVMVSDLILVARYFRLRYTYDTDHWIK